MLTETTDYAKLHRDFRWDITGAVSTSRPRAAIAMPTALTGWR